MKQKERELILQYFLNKSDYLDKEIVQLQNNLRYRRFSSDDACSFMLSADRYNFLSQIRNEILGLLSMESFGELPEVKYVRYDFDIIRELLEYGKNDKEGNNNDSANTRKNQARHI